MLGRALVGALVGSICVSVLHAARKDPEMQCAFLGLHLFAGASLTLCVVLRCTIPWVIECIHWFSAALLRVGLKWLYKAGTKVRAFRDCLVVFVNRYFPC
jgi:hypothetical protein